MLIEGVERWKQRTFPKGIRRELDKLQKRVFRRTTEAKLTRAIAQLGMPDGAVICVHSMLSGLGYLVGGPEMVIRAIQGAVPGCTIMMPTFPFSGSAWDYLQTDPVYDRDKTPSQSGLLTETLRNMPGALRSYHPTHPCVALGPQAEFLINGSENSVTPFGDDSTYGRFSSLDNAFLLLIHTNNTSIVHRIQEMVDMPNLFLDGLHPAMGIGPNGKIKEYQVKVHRPFLPLWVIIGDEQGDNIEYVWYPDYCLLFPQFNRERVVNLMKKQGTLNRLKKKNADFLQNGIEKIIKYRESEIMSIQLQPWIASENSEIRKSIEKYSDKYQLEALQHAEQQGFLTK